MDQFSVIADEYIVIGCKDRQLYFWSESEAECNTFCRVNGHLDVIVLHI